MNIAENIIEKCGGVKATAEIVGRSESWVYRWTYEKSKGGTGGYVPRDAQAKIMAAAQAGKVNVEASDFFVTPQGAA